MKIFYVCLLILYLTLPIWTVQANHLRSDSGVSPFFTILNSMMRASSLQNSKQIPNCFEDNQKQTLNELVNKLTMKAYEAGTVQLQNFPIFLGNELNSHLKEESIKCLLITRDMGLLFGKLKTPLAQMSKEFSIFVGDQYLLIHQKTVQLQKLLSSSQYDLYGQKLLQLLHTVFGTAVHTQSQWQKSVSNLQSFSSGDYYGVTVSNGVIGAVSSIRPISVSTTVLAGAYDVFGRGRVDNIVQTFPALLVEVDYGYDITSGGYYNYEQSLHFDTAQFTGKFSSDSCSVTYSYTALKNLPFTFYTSLQIAAHRSSQIAIKLKHQIPQYLNNIRKSFQTIDASDRFDIIHTMATTKTGMMELVAASSFMHWPHNMTGDLIHEDWDSGMHFLKLKMNVTKGEIYEIGFITCLISSVHHQDPLNQAIRIIERAISIGGQSLLKAHRHSWSELWKNDIIISGNSQDQKDVRLMLYHCYAFINDWKSYGISPMGLSGLGYNGHVFWDMDLWIYPGILALKPQLAKTLIEYRFQRLQAARNNAFINGYKGAMYPWQSSSLGVEQTPVWALTGPLEHHISGCVAFAAWNYYCVTQDVEWLRNKGYSIIASVAQFWASRVQLGEDNKYHIKNVVAADQWAQNVDDNAFTNAIAIKSLLIANLAAKKLTLQTNPLYTKIAAGITILKMQNNVTREHATYNGQNIKQADVNLLAFPLKTYTDVQQIKRDLVYYQSRIPNQGTPAMTYSIFTILYSRLKDKENAYKYFRESFGENLRKPFNVFAQTKGGTNPYFLTGAGGVIQSLVFGFGGYDITENGLVKIETVIPAEWTNVTIKGFLKS